MFERFAVPFCSDEFRHRVPDRPVFRCKVAGLVGRSSFLELFVGVGDILVALEGVAGGVVMNFCCPEWLVVVLWSIELSTGVHK